MTLSTLKPTTLAGLLAVLLGASSLHAGTGQVQVTVSTDASSPAEIYVAAVPADRPLGAPLTERIIKGHTATFTVPAGAYRFVAAAPDFAQSQSNLIFVADASVENVELRLEYYSSISGHVVDEARKPITHAFVGLPGAFLLDYPDNPSPMARRFMRQTDVVETDASGTFVLPVHGAGTNFLFAEARGYAPNMIGQVHAADGTVPEIRLARGASLLVHIKGSSTYDRIRLIPRNVKLPEVLSFSSAVALWTRQVQRDVGWESLPAGEYHLCFGVSPEREDQRAPRCVSRLSLAAGEHRTVSVSAPLHDRAVRPTAVTLTLLNASRADLSDIKARRWSGDRSEVVTPHYEEHGGGTTAKLDGCTPGTIYVFTGKTLVATTGKLADCQPRTLSFQPRRTMFVRLRSPVGAALPRHAMLIASGCEDRTLSFVVPFEIGEHGLAGIPLPFSCSDLRIQTARLFSPLLPKPQLRPQDRGEASEVQLRIGGSIAGRIANAGQGEHTYQVAVEAAQDADATGHAATLTVEPDSDGWFWIPAVSDGTYVLTVSGGGMNQPYRSAPFAVRPQQNVYLPETLLPAASRSSHDHKGAPRRVH